MLEQPVLVPAPARPGLRSAALLGLGHALAGKVVPTAEIAARLGVEEPWLVRRTGIRERRHAAPGETLAGLAAAAGRGALAAAALDPAAVDLVVVATTTPDQLTPPAAPSVAAELRAVRAGAVDVSAACTGFVAALALAAGQVEAGRAEVVLVVGADVLRRFTDPDDRRTAGLFGDGAGAVLVRRGGSGIGPFVLGADGEGAGLLFISRERAVVEMDGQAVFRHAVGRLAEAAAAACARAGVAIAELDLLVFHQANGRILAAVARRLGVEADRVVDCIVEHGNTSAASIPIALDAARRDGRLRAGARVLLAAFGAGFTWGAVVVEWGA